MPVAVSAMSRKSARVRYSTCGNASTREPLEDLAVPVRRRAQALLERLVLPARLDVPGDRVADRLLHGHAVDVGHGRELLGERRREPQRERLRVLLIRHLALLGIEIPRYLSRREAETRA